MNIFGHEPLGSNEATSPSSPSYSSIESERSDRNQSAEAGDIWELGRESELSWDRCLLKSWDTFPDHQQQSKSSASYLSETGSTGFDAALVFRSSKTGLEDSGRVARTDVFILSIFKLAMGWNSIFFRFNEQTRKFEKSMKDVRISGISLTSLDTFLDEVLHCGSQVRQIKRFLALGPSRVNSPPALATMSRAVRVLLHSLENQLLERYEASPSLLESQVLIRRSHCLIKCLNELSDAASNAATEGEVISSVFLKCDHLSHEHLWLTDILHEILALTAGTWFSSIATLIGLPRDTSETIEASEHLSYASSPILEAGSAFTTGLRMAPKLVTGMISSKMISLEHSDIIAENIKNLRFLKSFCPSHPFAQQSKLPCSVSLPLTCGFTWEDIDRIQTKAKAYEDCLRSEILEYNRKAGVCADSTSGAKETVLIEDMYNHNPVDGAFELINLEQTASKDRVLSGSSDIFDCKLYQLVSRSPCVNVDKNLGVEVPFGPPLISALYLSFAPPISAQTRLLNFSCLHLIFKKHKLREHLRLQWRFQLLGDSSFLARLSKTLFDPDMHSGERKSGVARGGTSTGLRLGSRDTWPPASSELRLVLTGLLSDCHSDYRDSIPQDQPETPKSRKELPGGLSFSIRDLPSDDLMKCKDPNSVEALDFLRLQYTPPRMLEDVITPRSLKKYDRIFKHLLRLLRLFSTARGLVRGLSKHSPRPGLLCEKRFCFEALHFVRTMSEYCFHACVGDMWDKFEKTLSRIEQCIDDGDIDGTIDHAKSLRRLREYHEDVLDQMQFAMLLSKRHAQVYALLETIFGTILAFSMHSKSAGGQEIVTDSYEQSTRDLYSRFRISVGSFVQFLRELGNVNSLRKKERHRDLAAWGSGSAPGINVDGIFDHLLLRLDMTNFY